MPTLQINLILPDGMEVADVIHALQKAGIKEISTDNEEDFIHMDEAISDIFPGMSHDEIAGELLKTARKHKNLTQTELASMISTQKQVISALESGKRSISKAMAKKLAKALDVHYKTFL